MLLAACTPAVSPQPTASLQITAVAGLGLIPIASASPQPLCTDSALFVVDATIPDNVKLKAGQPFTKTWQLRNNGTCAWNTKYALVFSSGNMMSSPASVALPDTPPGATLNLSVKLTAPAADGVYTAMYEIHNPAGQAIPIGQTKNIWTKIMVGNVAVTQRATSHAGSSIKPTPGITRHPASPCKPKQNEALVGQILLLINSARASAGVPALSENSELATSARVHSVDMACHNIFGHTGSDGSSIYQRIVTAGYSPAYWEEVIFAGGDAQQAFDWWMNDKPHRDALLNMRVTQMGVGYVYVAGSTYGSYFTVDFGRP